MPIADLVPWFQIGSTIIAGAGIVVSTTLGIIIIRNASRDRQAKIRPSVMFNLGGQVLKAKLEERSGIPGIAADDARKLLATRSVGSRCISSDGHFGGLFNHGAGLARNVHIWFQAEKVTAGELITVLTAEQMSSPPFEKAWNYTRSTPENIEPNKEGIFYRLPTPVVVADRSTKEISGKTYITYSDQEGKDYVGVQPTSIFFDFESEDNLTLTITFDKLSE